MLDHGKKWDVVPDWATVSIDTASLRVTSISGLVQHLVSGAIDAFVRDQGVERSAGGLGTATGRKWAARIARDRLLAVGFDGLTVGWQDGCAITKMSSALHVFEIAGASSMSLISRACVIDPANPGPSAGVLFAGVSGVLYRYERSDVFRLHVDRGLSPYIWSWISAQKLGGV